MSIRVAIALSGGVDSSVVALFLSRCVYTLKDIYALYCTSVPLPSNTKQEQETHYDACYSWVPSYDIIRHSIIHKEPWHKVHPSFSNDCEDNQYPEGDTVVVAENHSLEQLMWESSYWLHSTKSVTLNSKIEFIPIYMRNWSDDVTKDEAYGNATSFNANHKSLYTNEQQQYRCEHSIWCSQSEVDYNDAQELAHQLELLHSDRALPIIDLSAAYMDRCFTPMLEYYARGQTLNIDVLCNSEIKFDALLQELNKRYAEQKLHACEIDLLATGHYARSVYCLYNSEIHDQFVEEINMEQERQYYHENDDDDNNDNHHYYTKSNVNSNNNKESKIISTTPSVCSTRRNNRKNNTNVLLGCPRSANNDLNDQSLFLSYTSSHALRRGIFPCGHLFERKTHVRSLASELSSELGIPILASIARKKTSTGLCFVGNWAKSRQSKKQTWCERSFIAHSCNTDTADSIDKEKKKKKKNMHNIHNSKCHAFATLLDDYILSPHECDRSNTELCNMNDVTNSSITSNSNECERWSDSCTETVFREVETNKLLYLAQLTEYQALSSRYPNKLPSFAFTVGQRLWLGEYKEQSAHQKENGEKGKETFNEEHHLSSSVCNSQKNTNCPYKYYYVCKKVHEETRYNTTDAMGHVAMLLNEVHLVPKWDHPLLYKKVVHIQEVKVHISLDQLHKLALAHEASKNVERESLLVSIRCLCVVRHQDKPQEATLQWRRQDCLSTPLPLNRTSKQFCKVSAHDCDSHFDSNVIAIHQIMIKNAVVTFDCAVRAPVVGQVAVMYFSAEQLLSVMYNKYKYSDCRHDSNMKLQSSTDVLCAIACG